MPAPSLHLTDTIDPAIPAQFSEGLAAFNHEVVGYTDRRPLAVLAQQPDTGAVLGGMVGRSSLGLLFLDLVYLPPELRGGGLGRQMLAMFEAEGRRRGCRTAIVYTISFQAPGFYEKHGWQRFGTLPCDPPGTSRVFLSKQLAP